MPAFLNSASIHRHLETGVTAYLTTELS